VIIRELEATDDTAALLDLSVRAFGPVGDPHSWEATAASVIGEQRYLAAFDGDRMIAAARFHDMTQCWAGRWLRMAGVAGVAVAPEDRGRGTGRALMTALLGRIAERGYPVSVLYPATSSIYRSLGWETAGGCETLSFPARSLHSLVSPDPAAADGAGQPETRLRRCGPGDAAEVLTVVTGVHQALRDSGPNLRDSESVRQWLGLDGRFCYLAPDGFLAYRWQHGNDELRVDRALAVSAATTRAIWGIVASHSSIASTVRACLGPADPVGWLTREPDVAQTGRVAWMLRVVDAPAAITERGFPAGAEVTARLRLADPVCPGNEGLWLLEVSGGKGTLSRAPAARTAARPLRAGPRGLAALYAGTPLGTLRRAGLVADGDPATDAALDTVFAATPYLLETF
jgi:predicted acetyltransferase